jgi:hypothetical protein
MIKPLNGTPVKRPLPAAPGAQDEQPPAPACPKRCDVSMTPEPAGRGRWVCICCGTEFAWTAEGKPS